MDNTTATPTSAADTWAATFTLSMHRKRFPELVKAEAQSRLLLAAAIQRLDAAYDADPDDPALFEQVAVTEASQAYAQALADLLRGEQS